MSWFNNVKQQKHVGRTTQSTVWDSLPLVIVQFKLFACLTFSHVCAQSSTWCEERRGVWGYFEIGTYLNAWCQLYILFLKMCMPV